MDHTSRTELKELLEQIKQGATVEILGGVDRTALKKANFLMETAMEPPAADLLKKYKKKHASD